MRSSQTNRLLEENFMIKNTLKVKNKAGIHCRPSARIIETIEKYPNCDFLLSTENGETQLESILELLSLAIVYDDEVTLQVEGENEILAHNAVANLLETVFDFPQK